MARLPAHLTMLSLTPSEGRRTMTLANGASITENMDARDWLLSTVRTELATAQARIAELEAQLNEEKAI